MSTSTTIVTGGELTLPRSMKEPVGPTTYPALTRSNYGNWTLLMRVILQARGLWKAVEGAEDLTSDAGYRSDRMALEAILRAVPSEMLATLAVKATAKDAWDTIKTLRTGSERVRSAKAQTLRSEFEALKYKPGESIDDLSLRLTGIVSQLSTLGDVIQEKHVMEKFLRILPKRYSQLVMSVESLLDLNTLSMEDLTGRFKAAEERFEVVVEEENGGKLLLSEEEWLARMRRREHDGSFGSGGSGSTKNKRRGKAPDVRSKEVARNGNGKVPGGGRDVRYDKCRYCNKEGHWARDCRKKKRDEAHLTQVDDEEPGLLMAHMESEHGGGGSVFLNEESAEVHLGEEDTVKDAVWFLDTGASNHMTGNHAAFAELDGGITGSVRFGDGSLVEIKGRGTILFTTHGGRYRVLTNVYFIPKLRSNIVSVGQLDEVGCQVRIQGGVMCVLDRQKNLLAKVTRTSNRLYVISLNITKPVCMSISTGDNAWCWHARYGHLNFEALRKLARGGMVRGLPLIEHVDQVCDACLVGKQRRVSFPQVAKYRAEDIEEAARPGGK